MSRYPKNLQRLGASNALNREARAVDRDNAAKKTKLEPAPLAFPNGGGLKAMAQGGSKTLATKHSTEQDALEAKHAAEKAALAHKQAQEKKSSAKPAAKPTKGK